MIQIQKIFDQFQHPTPHQRQLVKNRVFMLFGERVIAQHFRQTTDDSDRIFQIVRDNSHQLRLFEVELLQSLIALLQFPICLAKIGICLLQ